MSSSRTTSSSDSESSSSSSSSSSGGSSSSSSESSSSVDISSEAKSDDNVMKLPTPLPVVAPPRPFPIRKGSVLFPSGKTSKIFDSREKHYRHLHTVGRIQRKNARGKRRKLRDTLIANDVNFDVQQYPTLQSSSSEESSVEEDNSEWERETVDMQALAHQSWWAKESLFGITPVSEISSLVGWATHLAHDGGENVGNDTAVARAAGVENESAASEADGIGNDRQQIPAHQEAACHEKASLLSCLPSTPLPPSHLQYLNDRALSFIANESAEAKYDWIAHSFLTNEDPLFERATKKTRVRKKWQQWEYDSEDETYQSLKKKEAESQVTLHVPCPPKKDSSAKANKNESNNGSSNKKDSRLYQSLDDSALVALGMVWEDMITASLMPLARQHVARCRRLEQEREEDASSNDVSGKTEEEACVDLFREWTLPPEQAIWRLAQEGIKSKLPSTQPPTRVSNQFFDTTTPISDMLMNRLGSTEQRQQQVVDDWCRTHDLDPAFVCNNMDLYGVFLPRAPSIAGSRVQITSRYREDRNEVLRRNLEILKMKQATASKEAVESSHSQKDNGSTAPSAKQDESTSPEEERIETGAV